MPTESEGVGFLVRHAHKAFTRALNRRLAKHDLPSSHWSALRALWQEDGCSQVELADRMRVEKASLTPVLGSLQRKGLIGLERCTDDRRKSRVRLTDEGRRLKATLLPYAAQVNAEATDGLSAEEVRRLTGLLVRLIDNLR